MKRLVGTLLAALCAQSLLALDFGADYPRTPPQPNGQGFYAGLAEQFTYFNNTQPGIVDPFTGRNLSASDQYLSTVTSEPYLGYNFCDRFGLQLELPVIYREFQALIPIGNPINPLFHVSGSQWGLGDIRLLGNFGLIQNNTSNCTVNWNLTAGIKFPTGDSGQGFVGTNVLGQIGSGFGGITSADLALGSGSYDGLVGTDILLRRNRLFFTAQTQYAIRSEGDFEYQFANDLSWYGGPGVYVLSKDNYSLSLQAIVSGDTKGSDTVGFSGDRVHASVPSTAETGVYLGPQIDFTWRDQITAQLSADLPVSVVTSGVQIVPTYRIQAAVTVRF